MLNQSPRSRNISPYLCTNHCHKVDFSLCASMYKKFSPWISPKSKLVLAWYKLWAEKGERRERRFVFCVLYKFLQANLRYRARRTHEAEHTSQREASLPHVMLVTFATLWPTVWSPRIDEWQRELCRDAKCVIPYRERQNMARQQRQIWSLFRGSNSAENISSVVSVERHLPYHLEDIPVITPMSWLDSPLIWFKRIIQKKLTVNTHIMSTNKTLRNANEGGSQIWIKKMID